MPQVAQNGTVRLSATFENSTGALVDPTTPTVDIINPSAAVVVNDAPLVRDSLGEYHYDFTAAANAPLGAWTARFSGVIDGATITGDEPFTVLAAGSVGVGQNWLIQLGELKDALGIDQTNTRKDALYVSAINAASRAIINYTERDFGSPSVTETREFEYDGSGYLDIDDATNVTAVSLVVPNADDLVVSTEAWRAMPPRRDDAPVYYYILLPQAGRLYPSVAMGFERNLDTYVEDYGFQGLPQTVKVTATFGWPDVPADVALAAVWTVRDWTSAPKASEGLTSEAIAGFSRSWGRMAGGGVMALPNAAKDLLADYQKIKV